MTRLRQEPPPDFRDLRTALQHRDQSAKCASPYCDSRVAYTGDFCRPCLNVQADMRRRLRARPR